jgi:Zn-dependent peptidase ImmA (M78 family)
MLKISNVEKGNKFEAEVIPMFEKLLQNGELSVNPKISKLRIKPKYYNKDRGSLDAFDLSIETYPVGAKMPSLVHIIECKHFSGTINVDELEQTLSLTSNHFLKVSKDSDYSFAVKVIFIFKGKISQTLSTKAKNNGVMLIEVLDKKDYKILLYKNEKKDFRKYVCLDKNIEKELVKTVYSLINNNNINQPKIEGLRRLSRVDVKEIARKEFKKVGAIKSTRCLKTRIVNYIEETYSIKVCYKVFDGCTEDSLGYLDINSNSIFINENLRDTKLEMYPICHEIGHFILHKDLINKDNFVDYLNLPDSLYNQKTGKYDLVNDRNFIEYQANTFAVEFFLNEELLRSLLVEKQIEMGFSKTKTGYIFADNQYCNLKDKEEIISHLSEYFNTTKKVIESRLEGLKMLRCNHFTQSQPVF